MNTNNADGSTEKIGISGYVWLVLVVLAISLFFVFVGDFAAAGAVFLVAAFLSMIALYIYGADKLNRLSVQKFHYKPVNKFFIGFIGVLGWGGYWKMGASTSMIVIFLLLAIAFAINVKKTSVKYAALSVPLIGFAGFCLPLVIYALFMGGFRPTRAIQDALKGEDQCKKEREDEKRRQKYLW